MKRVGVTGERYIHYQNGLYTIHKVLDKKQYSFGSFHTLKEAKQHRDYCIKHGWNMSVKRRCKPYELRYIFECLVGYQVAKNKDGVKTQYGYFKSLDEAKKHRDYCIEHDWDEKCIIRKTERHNLPKYITYSRDKRRYTVQKTLGNGESLALQGFKSLDEAIRERDLLIKVDWSIERLIELDECEGTL